jgi:hypothetical protein
MGPRELAADAEPAPRNEKVGTIAGCLAHDVSTVLGAGRIAWAKGSPDGELLRLEWMHGKHEQREELVRRN